MGKQKRERRKPHKENPTGLSSVKDFETEETESYSDLSGKERQAALEGVYEDLQSANVENKISALQTLESMSTDFALAVQIATDGITKKIGPLLLDQNPLVRTYTASALRYIAAGGEDQAYACLVRDDIMTPLSAVLQKYHAEWQPSQEQIKDEREAFVQAITLLWTLCENEESIVKHVNEQELVSVLAKFLDLGTYGTEIVIVTTQCLLSLSEDNPTAIKQLVPHEKVLLDLLSLETNEKNNLNMISLKTPVAGLLINIASSGEHTSINTVCKSVVVLSDVLAVSCSELLSKLEAILPHEKNNFSSNARKRVEESRRCLGAQQQALELLANLCSQDQVEDESDLEDTDIEDTEEEFTDVPMDEKCETISTMPVELIEVFNSCAILTKIWDKTTAVDKNTQEILEQTDEGKSVLKQIHMLRCRAYLCLSNLLSSLDIDVLGGFENIHRLWVDIGAIIFTQTTFNDIELIEAQISALAAALQRLTETKGEAFDKLDLTNIHPVFNVTSNRSVSELIVYLAGKVEELIIDKDATPELVKIRANIRLKLYRLLGNIALILEKSSSENSHESRKCISNFLLSMSKMEKEVWIMAECLDIIMDIFMEDETDQLAEEIELVDGLHCLVPIFKHKTQVQKKQLGDNAALVSTVNANIKRFIKYKEKRLRNMSKKKQRC